MLLVGDGFVLVEGDGLLLVGTGLLLEGDGFLLLDGVGLLLQVYGGGTIVE